MTESLTHTLELLSDRSMPGFRRRRLGRWILRSALGATGRANSVWVGGSPGIELSTAVDRAERWYSEVEMPTQFQLFEGGDPALVNELDRRGYSPGHGGLILSGPLPGPSQSEGAPTVVRSPFPPDSREELLAAGDMRRAELTSSELPLSRFEVYGPGERVLGHGVAAHDGRWLGVFAMETVPEARRRGIATRIIEEMGRWGRRVGAEFMWLQVEPGNHGAITLYRKLGLVQRHRYHYRYRTHPTG